MGCGGSFNPNREKSRRHKSHMKIIAHGVFFFSLGGGGVGRFYTKTFMTGFKSEALREYLWPPWDMMYMCHGVQLGHL